MIQNPSLPKSTVMSPFSFFVQRQWLPLGTIGFLVLGSAVGLVYTKHVNRSYYAKLQQLREDRDQLHAEWTQLLLEQGTLGSDMRVEKIARDDLGMNFPSPDKIVMIKP